jgi:molybdate transport system regulatory protein
MRNQLPCTVKEIRRMRSAVIVVVALPEMHELSARITLEGLQLLNLEPGLKVLCFFKATAVTVARSMVAAVGVNLFQGKVVRPGTGTSVIEVALQIAPGIGVVGFSDSESPLSVRELALAATEHHAIVLGLIS